MSLKIDKMDLIVRRWGSAFFVCFALIKIVALYMVIFMKQTLLRLLAFNGLVFASFYGFWLSYLLSLQINSAKNSYKIIHSIVCSYKMSSKLRLTLNQIKS